MFQSSDVTASGLQEAGVMFAPQLRLQVSRTSGIQLVRARTKIYFFPDLFDLETS